MQYLVQRKLVPQGRPTTPEEGTAFIEQYIFPTLELCKKLQDENEDSGRRTDERRGWTRADRQR
jgi:hypothetical protein